MKICFAHYALQWFYNHFHLWSLFYMLLYSRENRLTFSIVPLLDHPFRSLSPSQFHICESSISKSRSQLKITFIIKWLDQNVTIDSNVPPQKAHQEDTALIQRPSGVMLLLKMKVVLMSKPNDCLTSSSNVRWSRLLDDKDIIII